MRSFVFLLHSDKVIGIIIPLYTQEQTTMNSKDCRILNYADKQFPLNDLLSVQLPILITNTTSSLCRDNSRKNAHHQHAR